MQNSPFKGPLPRPVRKPVRLEAPRLCRLEPPGPGSSLPLRIVPEIDGLDLAAWLKNNRGLVTESLRKHGVILFRGFGIRSPELFERAIGALSSELLEYGYRSTPRTRVAGKIYTSTEYPADRAIPLHSEMAYSRSWPMKLWFCCVTPAARGGETPIADCRRVLERILPATRRRFEEKGVMYVRNYGQGLDLPWEEVFQTSDRAEVERQCQEAGIRYDWKPEGRLLTRQTCQGVAEHPDSGEVVWYNQAHLFHVSSLGEESRAVLLENFREEDLPRNAYYGDGSPIEPETIREIGAAFDAEAVAFPWERGDVTLVDNMLAAHGRRPYEGTRRILVGMTELHGAESRGIEL
jgi:alpha-ketoglutarate-dependent taurine dioxygenase